MRSLPTRRAARAQLIAFTCAFLIGCAPPPAVGTFAEQANLVMEAGKPITDDLPASCERRHWIGQPLGQATLLAPARAPKLNETCDRFRQESTEIAVVRRVLADYFSALAQLSRFNTASISEPAGITGTNAGTAGNLSPIQSDSAGKLASILTKAMTEHYRSGKMVQLVREADGSVSALLTGLEQIAGSDYESLLEEEERTRAGTFREAGLGQSPSMVLLLNRAYREEIDFGQRRSQAAASYVSALRAIRTGHAALAKLGAAKSAKITAALAPHITELKRLLPVIRAAA